MTEKEMPMSSTETAAEAPAAEAPVTRNGPVSREAVVAAALKEISSNYRRANLSSVAQKFGVSLAYVSECVRGQTGRTYKELLQKHRIEIAARQLRRTDWTIQHIISYVGYENTSYFYRLFRERYGCSPREYRIQYDAERAQAQE